MRPCSFFYNFDAKCLTMLKRFLVGGILAVVTVGTLIFVLLQNIDSVQVADVAEAVPSNAILFVDKADFEFFTEEFLSENQVWEELCSYSYFSEFDSLVTVFNHHIKNISILADRLRDEGLSFSIHLLGKNKIAAIFYVVLDEDTNSQDIDNEIKSALGRGALVNKRKYEAVELTDVSLNNTNALKGFSYGIEGGLLIASTSSILLEDAIRSLNSGGGIYHHKGLCEAIFYFYEETCS